MACVFCDACVHVCVCAACRAEWLPPVAASACTACGENIYSSPDEQIPVFAITPDAAPSEIEVRATDAACCECAVCLGCNVRCMNVRWQLRVQV